VTSNVIVDTGPLVALLRPADRWHGWVKAQLAVVVAPLLTCESVISETSFLLRQHVRANEALMGLFRRGMLEIRFDLQREILAIDRLLRRYANVPMSFADACLVRMAEVQTASKVLTLDGDFPVYRKNGRQSIPLLAPDS
jgi:predicted nucleic acid-binding protein